MLHICWWYWILMAKINNFATFACWRPPWGVMCWERLVGWQKHSIIGIFIGYFNLFLFLLKHRELLSSQNNFRNCECCPLSFLIEWSLRMSLSGLSLFSNFRKSHIFLHIATVTSYLRHCLVWNVKTKRKFDKIKRIFSGVGL